MANQLQSLARHLEIPFILENPANSELWDLKEVKESIAGIESWSIKEVDRCAYGREEKKPTKFLTNIPWQPKGTTGNA